MRRFGFFPWLAAALLLSACQTVPVYKAERSAFAEAPRPESAVIRVTSFQVPKDEPVTTFLLVLGAIGGANINQPVFASVFDVTDDLRYLGTLGVGSGNGAWLEASAPPGPRRLMLTLAGSSSVVAGMPPGHVDFMDVDAKAGGITHVALARHGFSRFPYLHEIAISAENLDACSSMAGTRKERLALVEQYMAGNRIAPAMRDFKWYCAMLSDPKRIQTPTDEALSQFARARPEIERLRSAWHAEWKSSAEVQPPYDLMRSYEPPPAQSALGG